MAVEFNPRLLKDKGQPYTKPEEVVFRPETYLAAGDGVKDDTAALYRMSQAVNEAGGGVIELRPGATYLIGGQTLRDPAFAAIYTYYPAHTSPIDLSGCSRGVVIRGNGARIKCMDGAKYGTFNTDGTVKNTSLPYFSVGASTPYFYMIFVRDCHGVHIENIELDGNLANLSIGGGWGDTGIQLQATGYFLEDNTGPVTLTNVYTHDHGADGCIIDAPADSTAALNDGGIVIGMRSERNGRQACSFVGGRAWTFIGCKFNYTGMAAVGSGEFGSVASNPGAGFDFEAEAGKRALDIVFHNCEFVGNKGQGILADASGNVARASFYDCLFIGTVNYAIWAKRPGFKFYRSRIIGCCPQFNIGTSPFAPDNATQFVDCFFSNDATLSPTGALMDANDLLWEGGGGFVRAVRCTFEHHLGNITGGLGSSPDVSAGNGPYFEDCRFIAKAGSFGPTGRFLGSCWFIEDGGTITRVPAAETPGVSATTISGKLSAGPAHDYWYFRTSNANTEYGPTIGRGYSTGSGGTVTQATSKSTGVTLHRLSGQVTMNNASLASAASVSFTLTNNKIAATDVVLVSIASGATADAYDVTTTAVAAGSCRIQVRNVSQGSLGEALVLNFVVLKGASS